MKQLRNPIAIITNFNSDGYGKNQTVTFEALGNEVTEEIFIGLYNGNNYANYTTIEAQNGKYEVKITEEGTYTIFTIAYGKDGSRNKGFEMTFKVEDNSNGLTMTGYFLLGVGEELFSVIKGTIDFLLDIPGGIESMGEGIKFLWRARTPGTEESDLLQEMAAAIIDEFNTGTGNEQARMAGRVTVQVVLTLIAIKGVANGTQALITEIKDGTLANIIINTGKNAKAAVNKIIQGSKLSVNNVIPNLKNVEIFRKDALTHIFSGNKSGGYHYEGLNDSLGKVVEITGKPNKFGVYKANVEIAGEIKSSTFFPKNWSAQKVVNAINKALGNKVFFKGNQYRGTLKNGLVIEICLTTTGKVITAYPLY